MEYEVKYHLPHLAGIRKKMLSRGGWLLSPRFLERNLRFDTPEGSLAAQQAILRLRQARRATLTYKRADGQFEARHEIEVEVNDLAAAASLLKSLGFVVTSRYEKYREVFAMEDVQVMLDELPYGCFVEIEGPSLESVRRASQALGFDWEERIQMTYLDLFIHVKARLALAAEHPTFEAFGALPDGAKDLIEETLRDVVKRKETAREEKS
ncbi:MAG TPA: class IV adenylate cyclase [Chloroflexi bacterium]|nr:class IV adenylate cyclase [Chloroflexota bacterium]